MMRPDNEYSEPSSGAPTTSRDTYDTISDRNELEAFLSQKPHEDPPAARQQHGNEKETSFDPDPYRLNRVPDSTGMASPADRRMAASLIDDEGDDSVTSDVENATAGIAGLLEMEAEPSRTTPGRVERPQQQQRNEQSFASPFEPIRTSSGLLLTHRRTPHESKPQRSSVHRDTPYKGDDENEKKRNGFSAYSGSPVNRRTFNANERFETESPWSAQHSDPYSPKAGSFLHQAQRILSVARLGVIASGIALLLGTIVLLHSVHHERTASSAVADSTHQQQQGSQSGRVVTLDDPLPDRIILVPFQNYTQHRAPPNQRRLLDRVVSDMRTEFESWVQHHDKVYHTHAEKEKRFNIWTKNHERTIAKNERHGPCKLTKQPVFGSNHFKDLSHDEFKSKFLSKNTGPMADQLDARKTKAVGVLGPHIAANHHPDVHRRIEEQWTKPAAGYQATNTCKWYDASCILRKIYNTYFYGFTTIMEPGFDADSYPTCKFVLPVESINPFALTMTIANTQILLFSSIYTAVDWRTVGAVTQVHSQGNCGACWAITAVESVESAIFLSKGTLYDLSETEVIVCADDCEMCYGGWPQDAFDYIMENKGIPLESTCSYDGAWLLKLSAAKAGTSDELR
jgi:hypothetical protein